MSTAQRKNTRASPTDPPTDEKALIQIARKLRSSADMGIAEAIRAIGIRDPSTIRRLRRKFGDQPISRAANLRNDASPKKAKALRNAGEQIKTSRPELSRVPRPLSSDSSVHGAAPTGSKQAEIGNAGPSLAVGPKFAYGNVPILPLADPMQLYRTMLMWSPLGMLLWQQAVLARTTSKFLRP
jgi:hypothetical protein